MFLTADELAQTMQVTVAQVYVWQETGSGPDYTECYGRRIYLPEAVAAWEAAQTGGQFPATASRLAS